MSARKLAIDPLWQCLCPSWTAASLRGTNRVLGSRRPSVQCANLPPAARTISKGNKIRRLKEQGVEVGPTQAILNPLYNGPLPNRPRQKATSPPAEWRTAPKPPVNQSINYREEDTPVLYNYMRGAAIDGQYHLCRFIAEMLVQERGEKPNIQLYNTLILSNISAGEGAAWRVSDLLAELEEDGLQADISTCHAVLKVLSVHVDHLLRTDVLEYMSRRWFQLTEDGAHDVAAGLFREGLFEQALQRLDKMRQDGMHVRPWLLDMAVYILCEENEIGEAHRLMRSRIHSDEPNISRALWMFFLDKASEMRHHAATSLAWSNQVNTEYINPSSGMCLNVLSTAAQAADAELATEVFTKLSQRGATFQPIHYELLINTYLAADPPDVKRALTILTIMALEKIEPSISETRSLFKYLREHPELIPQAEDMLRELHEQGRKIPIAVLNLLIECYVHQDNLASALNLYKQIHTFVPLAEGAKKTFANIETFNLLLKGCHRGLDGDAPDEHQASFLVSELLALRIVPTAMTFDRLIITFANAAQYKFKESVGIEDAAQRVEREAKGKELLDWAFRHFQDMQPLGWLPRLGTLKMLSVALAEVGDLRCWDVVQAGEDHAADVDGWPDKGKFVRRKVEEVWSKRSAETSKGESSKGTEADNGTVQETTGEHAGKENGGAQMVSRAMQKTSGEQAGKINAGTGSSQDGDTGWLNRQSRELDAPAAAYQPYG